MDVERLLGSLMGSGLGKKSRKGGMSKMVKRAAFSRQGMTLLAGIGIAAYEHFRSRQSPAAPPPTAGGSGTWTPAPPPVPTGAPAAPPPFPGTTWGTSTAAPPPPQEPDLMLRAMVLAALADGVLDADERAALNSYLERDGVTEAERAHLGRLMADPGTIDGLVAAVKDPGTAAEVWAAARLAIDPDTAAEQAFLAELAAKLGLDETALAEIEARLEEAGA